MASFSSNFTDVIERLGISQTEVAKRLGMSQGVVSMWLAGKRVPPDRTIEFISRTLGCSVYDLCDDPSEAIAMRELSWKQRSRRKGEGLIDGDGRGGGEVERLREENAALRAENAALRKKLADIQKILPRAP